MLESSKKFVELTRNDPYVDMGYWHHRAEEQGWQVSTEHGLNHSLNPFKPSRQKEVSASFCHKNLD